MKKSRFSDTIGARNKVDHFTFPSLNVDLDPGGYLEDLGLILGILAIMVSSI